jgi:hypothetical protein
LLPGTDCFTNPSALPSDGSSGRLSSSSWQQQAAQQQQERALGGLVSA